jgi:hypothetical protein
MAHPRIIDVDNQLPTRLVLFWPRALHGLTEYQQRQQRPKELPTAAATNDDRERPTGSDVATGDHKYKALSKPSDEKPVKLNGDR